MGSWKDPENSVRYFVRKEIEFSLNGYGGGYKNEVFTDLFYFAGDLGMFDVPTDFGKQLMLAVSKHVDVQTVDAYERTPLIVAVSLDAEEAVGTLIDRGADMEQPETLTYISMERSLVTVSLPREPNCTWIGVKPTADD